MKNFGIIILAAGESKRFGSPKQLVKLNGKTLLQNVIDEAAKVDGAAVVVVTGAHHEEISAAHETSHIIAGINEQWESGMASSIQTGLQRLLQNYTGIDGCIIAVSDQPYLSAEIFESLITEKNNSGKGIAASAYAGTLGTPVYLDKKYFEALMQLKRNEGAKQIVAANSNDLSQIAFEKGAVDIDTEKDLENLR